VNFDIFISFFIPLFLLILGIGFFFRGFHFRSLIFAVFVTFSAYLQFIINVTAIGYYDRFPHILFTNFPFGATLGPLIYFFVLSITEDKNHLNRKDLLHFVLPLVSLIVLSPAIFSSSDKKIAMMRSFLEGGYHSFRSIVIAFMSVFVAYAAVSIYKICKNFRKENLFHRKILVLLLILATLVFIVVMKALFVYYLSLRIYHISNIFLFFVVVFIYFSYQRYPNMFLYGTLLESRALPRSSLLEKLDVETLKKQLKALMEEEKFYCDEDLSLNRLSRALEITSHQLSEFLNSVYNRNFNSFINQYRIEESKKLLLENKKRNTLSIAYSVGFNSYTAFYNAFKGETGISPADYRKTRS